MHRLALSLLLVAAASSSAQITSPTGSMVASPPEPTVYGLELIRAEHWRPQSRDHQTHALPADAADHNASRDSIAEYRTLIRDLETEQGPYTGELAEVLTGLGHNYQNLGEHQSAIDSFRRSIHLTRVNRGPFTEEQIPLLDSLRESLLAEEKMGELDQLQGWRENIFSSTTLDE